MVGWVAQLELYSWGLPAFQNRQAGKERGLLCSRLRNGWIVENCLWETATDRLRTCGWKLRMGPPKDSLWVGSAPVAWVVVKASCFSHRSLAPNFFIQMEAFNHPDISWESSTAGWEQSRRLLECLEDKPTGPGSGQTSQRSVAGPRAHMCWSEKLSGGCLDCNSQAMDESMILRNMGLMGSRVNFHLFKKNSGWDPLGSCS